MAQVRAPMPPSKRAKIFSMFDALKGLKEALAAKERIPEERKILAADAIEELDRILPNWKKAPRSPLCITVPMVNVITSSPAQSLRSTPSGTICS